MNVLRIIANCHTLLSSIRTRTHLFLYRSPPLACFYAHALLVLILFPLPLPSSMLTHCSVCTCASGYTGAGCTPPPALIVSNAGGLSGAYAFNGSAFLTSTDSVKSPVYSCSTCSVGPTFLSYRSDRKEWSFAPSPAFASSVPRCVHAYTRCDAYLVSISRIIVSRACLLVSVRA